MSIKNIGTNKWRVVVPKKPDSEGVIRYHDKIFRGTQQGAKDFEAKLIVEENGTPGSSITLDCLFDIWIETLTNGPKKREQNTIDYYDIAREKHISPVLGKKVIRSLTSTDIENFFKELPLGSVRVMCKKTLSASLNWAVRKRMLPANPLHECEIKYGKSKGKRNYDAFLKSEAQAILAAARGTDIEAGVLVMLCEGARREEACGFDWEHFDPSTGIMPVTQAYVIHIKSGEVELKGPKNDDSWRDLIFKGYAKERLIELREGKTGPIMAYKGERMRPDYFYRRFKKLVDTNGIRYLPVNHLRHTYATRMLQNGTDPETLRQLLGHAKLSTIFERYVKSSDQAKDKARDSLSDDFRPQETPKDMEVLTMEKGLKLLKFG